MLAASVRVQCDQRGGSGVVIYGGPGRGCVLTNRHVAVRPGAALVAWGDGRSVRGQVTRIDAQADLALIEFDAPQGCTAVAMAARPPQPGSTVWQCGYPRGRGPRLSTGVFVGSAGQDLYGGPSWDFRFASDGGDSGSGIFNEDGELIALVWGGPAHNPMPQHTYGVALASLQRFVSAHCDWWRRDPKTPAAPLQPPAGQDQVWLKINELVAEIANLKQRQDVDPAKLRALEERVMQQRDQWARQIEELAAALRQTGSLQQLRALEERVDQFRSQVRDELAGAGKDLQALKLSVQDQGRSVDALDRKLAVVEAAAGGAAPIVGAISGPAGVAVGAIALLVGLYRRRRSSQGSKNRSDNQTANTADGTMQQLLPLILELVKRPPQSG